jgi:hypothetical protein
MWVIQGEVLIRLPDDAPVPPDSVKVEVPGDFRERPEAYRLGRRGVVRRSEPELRRERERAAQRKLTEDEVTLLKQAIADGRLGRPGPDTHGQGGDARA